MVIFYASLTSKAAMRELGNLKGTVMWVSLFSDPDLTEIATYDLFSCQNVP